MVDVPPPPKKNNPLNRPRLGPPPKPDTAAINLTTPSDGGYLNFVDLNFKVEPRFHARFRLEAALRKMSMKELMENSFKAFLDVNGGTMEAPRFDLAQG